MSNGQNCSAKEFYEIRDEFDEIKDEFDEIKDEI